MHFLRPIEFHLPTVAQIALAKYEYGKGAKKCERLLVSKVKFT